MIHYFGYAKEQPGQDKNETGFFDYSTMFTTAENLANHCKFRSDSQRALEYVTSAEFNPNKHYVSNSGDAFNLLD